MPKPTIAARSPVVLELAPGTYWWCRCGKSAKQPFCDGSHAGSGFAPLEFTVAAKERVPLCRCKHTGHSPRCDGAHKALPAS